MNSQVKAVRKALGLIQTDFGARLGVSGAAITRIEKGTNNLTDQMKKAIIREFEVNPEYLEHGIEPMFMEEDDSLVELARRVIIGDDPRAKAFLKIVATLPEEQLALLEGIMDRTLAEIRSQSEKNP